MLQGQSAHAKVLAQVLFISRAFHFGLELFRKGHLMKTFKTALAAVAWAGISSSAAIAQTATHGWVQYTFDSKAQARVVIAATETCPQIMHDTGKVDMILRSKNAPTGFDKIRVCEGDVDATMMNMSAGGISLPTPKADPKKIAVLGDTGCRVAYGTVQNCTGNGTGPKWDYVDVANSAAGQSPDLLIHVGDMHYREESYGKCGPTKGCLQKNIGLTWSSWQADFFDPSAKLLSAAAMIPVRGNHEDCSRAWRGWFFLLDPEPIELANDIWPDQCPTADLAGQNWNYTAPYPVKFDNLQVIVMDTSRIDHDTRRYPDGAMVAQYTGEFTHIEKIAQDAGTLSSWLVTHRPFWAVASWGTDSAGPTDLTLQAALKASKEGALPAQVKATMAGHIHLAQQVNFPDARPKQFVFGNGGTKRDPALGTASGLSAQTITALRRIGADKDSFFWSYDFSYGIITAGASTWDVAFKDKAGADLHQTTFSR
ncbi:MAG: hypothetical protein ACI9PY_001300 [Ascidiaceihabitans sp.]|jgi:hypothetical protein